MQVLSVSTTNTNDYSIHTKSRIRNKRIVNKDCLELKWEYNKKTTTVDLTWNILSTNSIIIPHTHQKPPPSPYEINYKPPSQHAPCPYLVLYVACTRFARSHRELKKKVKNITMEFLWVFFSLSLSRSFVFFVWLHSMVVVRTLKPSAHKTSHTHTHTKSYRTHFIQTRGFWSIFIWWSLAYFFIRCNHAASEWMYALNP